MILVIRRYDLSADKNMQEVRDWSEKTVAVLKQAPGFIDIQVCDRIAGSQQIMTVAQWESLGAWTRFIEGRNHTELVAGAPGFVRMEVEVYRVR